MILRRSFILAILLAATPANAADMVPPIGATLKAVTLQGTAIALNGSQSALTSTAINVQGYSYLRLTYVLTHHAGTDFALHCEASDTGTTVWRHVDAPNSLGVLQKDAALFSYTSLAASRTFDIVVPVASYRYVRFYPIVASADGADTITSTYVLYRP